MRMRCWLPLGIIWPNFQLICCLERFKPHLFFVYSVYPSLLYDVSRFGIECQVSYKIVIVVIEWSRTKISSLSEFHHFAHAWRDSRFSFTWCDMSHLFYDCFFPWLTLSLAMFPFVSIILCFSSVNDMYIVALDSICMKLMHFCFCLDILCLCYSLVLR